RLPLTIRLLDRKAGAEGDARRILLVRIHDDCLLEARLKILDLAGIGGGLGLREPLLELRVARGRHVIGMPALRAGCNDFGIAVVFFDKCAAHGTLEYTRSYGKMTAA